MFDQLENRLDEIDSRLKVLGARVESTAPKQWPRWMTLQTAGEYMDKTYEGMRYTLAKYKKEFPQTRMGDKPYVDRNDIDKFFLNGKK